MTDLDNREEARMGIDFEPTLNPDGRLAAFESKTLEYKRDLSATNRIMRALVAFAPPRRGEPVGQPRQGLYRTAAGASDRNCAC
jgi:hypothetical protein